MSSDQMALLHIIQEHLRDPIMQALVAFPQYAYRNHASTLDAICMQAHDTTCWKLGPVKPTPQNP